MQEEMFILAEVHGRCDAAAASAYIDQLLVPALTLVGSHHEREVIAGMASSFVGIAHQGLLRGGGLEHAFWEFSAIRPVNRSYGFFAFSQTPVSASRPDSANVGECVPLCPITPSTYTTLCHYGADLASITTAVQLDPSCLIM
jgi:hypothetical protein